MRAAAWGSRVTAGGDEDYDSDDEDCWDIGAAASRETKLDQVSPADKKDVFQKALTSGDVSLIEELLNSGMNIEDSIRFGWTPLMHAASVADYAVVRLLLDRGANACFEIDKYTVLMAACAAHASEKKILRTVELLLSRNVDPNLACRKQMTPLMYAAKKGYSHVVSLLVAHGSHVNAQDETGYSALIWAAHHGHKNVVLVLLELGADKNLQTKNKKTAAEIAKLNEHSEIYSLLSLTVNHSQGKYCGTTKQETVYKFLAAASDHSSSSCSTFDAIEVFLHGIGLEHIIGLLKDRDVYLWQLLTMQKEEMIQIGITNPVDQEKLLDAIKELQVEETRFKDLPELANLEISGDECLKFLQKLNKECSNLIVPVQTINKYFLENSHKMVLQWAPTERYIEVCKDLICNVEKLGEEVKRLNELVAKDEERKSDASLVVFPAKTLTLEKRLVKMGAITLLGFGFFFFITKLTVKKS
ncbi:ankyrin repeat, SAM and basic leucine zipper domain-containing protein 1 isoform X2 [Coturnix japonica]|uniref:ankyrin repeat, SAM and basic leucine zipper domain-containing protein 1 isoform X2 n=1 Tax=Coturnix japonica TaxID=93934 RepID=UPI000777CACC|nr:ankyrin repeat, SAM and basic leucine zipper domain-containing protein 1 isoform X2 [Coturnix japonica]